MRWYEVESKTGEEDWLNWFDEAIEAESPEDALNIYKAWMQDELVQSCDAFGMSGKFAEDAIAATQFKVKEAEMFLDLSGSQFALRTVCGRNTVLSADYWEAGVDPDDEGNLEQYDEFIERWLGYLPEYEVG